MTSRRKRNLTILSKWVVYFLFLLVAATLQSLPGFLQIGSVKPLFILPFCLGVAIYQGEYSGAFFAVLGGFLWDWTGGRIGGLMALGMMLVCFFAAMLVELYLRVNYINFILVTFACALLMLSTDFLFYYLMQDYVAALHRYLWVVVPSAVYTALLSPLSMKAARFVAGRFVVED